MRVHCLSSLSFPAKRTLYCPYKKTPVFLVAGVWCFTLICLIQSHNPSAILNMVDSLWKADGCTSAKIHNNDKILFKAKNCNAYELCMQLFFEDLFFILEIVHRYNLASFASGAFLLELSFRHFISRHNYRNYILSALLYKAYLQSRLDKIYYLSRSKDSAQAWETKLIRHAEERTLRFYP